MDPISTQKSLTMGLIFKNFHGSICELREVFENLDFFFHNRKKFLRMGPYFGKISPEHGYGSRIAGAVAHSQPIQIWEPPPPLVCKCFCSLLIAQTSLFGRKKNKKNILERGEDYHRVYRDRDFFKYARWTGLPTCIIALEKSPLLRGDSVCRLTLPEPALSPKIVTLSGSPPKAGEFKGEKKINKILLQGQNITVEKIFYFMSMCQPQRNKKGRNVNWNKWPVLQPTSDILLDPFHGFYLIKHSIISW